MHFISVKKSSKRFGFLIFLIFILKTVYSQQLKGMQKSKLGYVKGVPFVNREYTKGLSFG